MTGAARPASRTRAVAGFAALVCTGCLDHILDAPYVLSTGLGEVRGLAPTARHTLFVATSTGTWQIDGSGQRTAVDGRPARAITTHGTRLYVLHEDEIRWGPTPADGPAASLVGAAWPGALDLQAACDDTVMVATATSITRWDPATDTRTPWPAAPDGITAIGLGARECEELFVVAGSRLWSVTEEAATPLTAELSAPRAVTRDSAGAAWMLLGEPPVLARIVAGEPQVRARHLGDPRDLHFGTGELLAPLNVYIADGAGTVDYVRVPEE